MKSKTSLSNLLERSLKLSLTNIWRNKVLSLATIFVIAIIIFIFNIILAVNFIAQNALQDLNKKVDLTLYLKESTDYQQAQDLAAVIQTLEGVESATYTSKGDALETLKITHPDLSLAFEKYDLGNPLPASINVKTTHPKYHQAISNFLSQDQYKNYLSNIDASASTENNSIISSVSKNLLQMTVFTHQIIFWLIMIFILGGALIILNALQITIFTRREEIKVMKLVGASNLFIRSPFIIESVIYGTLAVIGSFIMLGILSNNIQVEYLDLWQFVSVFFIELAITIILSIISSLIAIHEYVR